jgi:hypothetical protein
MGRIETLMGAMTVEEKIEQLNIAGGQILQVLERPGVGLSRTSGSAFGATTSVSS